MLPEQFRLATVIDLLLQQLESWYSGVIGPLACTLRTVKRPLSFTLESANNRGHPAKRGIGGLPLGPIQYREPLLVIQQEADRTTS
jgi:hypothetical protein